MGLAKADPIETFHLSFLKFILNVKTSTPNCFVYGELGVLPQSLQRRIRVIKLWLKIIKPGTPNSSFMVGVYNELLEINREDPKIVTWVSLVVIFIYLRITQVKAPETPAIAVVQGTTTSNLLCIT